MQLRSGAQLRTLLLHSVMFLLLTSCGPVLPAPKVLQGDFRVHDPALIKQDATYYVYSTGNERDLNHGTIQIRRSTDLANWELVGTVFSDIPEWIGPAIGGTPPNLWAPDIAYFNGKYHLYYAGSRFGTNTSVIGLATNATLDPASPDYGWEDQGLVIQSTRGDNWNAIDPNTSFDVQNNPWMSFGSFWDGVKMRRIDQRTGKLAQDDTRLYALASRGGGPIEALAIVYRQGYYYLFVSFDFCCRGANSSYRIKAGRASSITGPYTDKAGNPMLQGGGDTVLAGQGRFIGPGGQSVYLDNGVYRLVHHYYDASDNGVAKLQILDLVWTSDGWPLVEQQ